MNRIKLYYKLSNWLYKLSVVTGYARYAFYRKADSMADLRKVSEGLKECPLTADQQAKVNALWKKYHVGPEWFQYYKWLNKGDTGFDVRYIPSDVEYCCFDDYFSKTLDAYVLDDKNMYDLYFPDVRMPRTIVRVMGGGLLDVNYNPISLEKAVECCRAEGNVVCKLALYSAAGQGVHFWNAQDGDEKLIDILTSGRDYVVQELFHQHSAISAIYSGSVNTLRMMTFYHKGEMRLQSALLRMGSGGSKLDNASAGGVFCGINEDGTLKKYGYYLNGDRSEVHPQGVRFEGHQLPSYDKCKELICNLAYRFLRVSKTIWWDMSVAEDGTPVLIEVNLTHGGVESLQTANGPLYGDETQEILEEVFQKKRYRRFMKWVK